MTLPPYESARQHAARTRHSVTEGIDDPWTCDNCPSRSAMYDLPVAPLSDAPAQAGDLS